MTTQEKRIAEIREAIDAENVSLGELSELQDIAAEHPELFADDPVLAEAAGIPEEQWREWQIPAEIRLGIHHEAEESAKHAPGPWEIGYRNDGAPVVTSEARDVCLLETYYGDQQANARLIAAAPDLLEALRRLVFHLPKPEHVKATPQWLAGFVDSSREARQAIAKAEGRAGE